MTLIKCENLCLAYEGKTVVENLSFEINDGDYLYIVGENGSGKSTLAKSLLGLKNISSGKIITNELFNFCETGYLPQQSQTQKDFPASVFEVVLSGCLNRLKKRFFYSAAEKSLALKNMDLMGITQLKNHSFQELSGGQQQRVLLARALCAAKKLILLDEPASGLDPKVTKELYDLIEKINKNHKMTIVMISHDIKAAVHYASHILHIGQNNSFFGSTADYLLSSMGKDFLGGSAI